MLRTTAGLGPYLVVCADCMLAMVYIAVLVCTYFLFTLISPFRLSSLFSLTCHSYTLTNNYSNYLS